RRRRETCSDALDGDRKHSDLIAHLYTSRTVQLSFAESICALRELQQRLIDSAYGNAKRHNGNNHYDQDEHGDRPECVKNFVLDRVFPNSQMENPKLTISSYSRAGFVYGIPLVENCRPVCKFG